MKVKHGNIMYLGAMYEIPSNDSTLQANQIPLSKTRGLVLGAGSVSLQWVGREGSGLILCSVFSLEQGGLLSSTLHRLTVHSAPVITQHSGSRCSCSSNTILSTILHSHSSYIVDWLFHGWRKEQRTLLFH